MRAECGGRSIVPNIFNFLAAREIERNNLAGAQLQIGCIHWCGRVAAIQEHRDRAGAAGGFSDQAADVARGHQIERKDGFARRVGIDLGGDLRGGAKQFSRFGVEDAHVIGDEEHPAAGDDGRGQRCALVGAEAGFARPQHQTVGVVQP